MWISSAIRSTTKAWHSRPRSATASTSAVRGRSGECLALCSAPRQAHRLQLTPLRPAAPFVESAFFATPTLGPPHATSAIPPPICDLPTRWWSWTYPVGSAARAAARRRARSVQILPSDSDTVNGPLSLSPAGLLPPAQMSQSLQVQRVMTNLAALSTPLEKYSFLVGLQARLSKCLSPSHHCRYASPVFTCVAPPPTVAHQLPREHA